MLERALGIAPDADRGAVEVAFLGLLNRGRDDGAVASSSGTRGVSISRWLYNHVDRWKSSSDLDILQPSDLGDLRGAPPATSIDLHSTAEGWRIPSDDATNIGARNLDLIVDFSECVPPSSLAGCARLGAAGFVLSDHAEHGDTTDGIPEVLTGEGTVGVRLELFADGARQPVLVVDSVTNADPYSAARTRANAAWHCLPLFDRLVQAVRLGPDGQSRAALRALDDRRRRSKALLTRAAPGAGLASLGLKYARSRIVRASDVDRWEMAYQWTNQDVTGHPDLTISRYRALHPPADRFWADPFPFRAGDRYYILFEEARFADERGYICAIEVGPNGAVGERAIVLDLPYHLSYPFAFAHGGEHYLLPESGLEGRLELYRAVKPPYEWTLDRILIDNAHLVDATIAGIDGKWWLFGCRYIPGLREWNDLMLYHAPSPLGPWTAHPRNPVISDVRSARPAGKLYSVDGSWYRPAQDCSRTYGGALTIQRIVRLSESEYEEEEVARMDPGAHGEITGVHTLNRLGPLTVIDLKRRRARRSASSNPGGIASG